MYSLVRERDGAGDSGPMSLAITLNAAPGGEHLYEHGSEPKVGAIMRVGSMHARSYSGQDYWQTTPVTEILERNENHIKFKTGNSVYDWKAL